MIFTIIVHSTFKIETVISSSFHYTKYFYTADIKNVFYTFILVVPADSLKFINNE